jgi:hypothetical protein
MLNIDTRTADKKTTYSTFCRAIAIRAVHPHSFFTLYLLKKGKLFLQFKI